MVCFESAVVDISSSKVRLSNQMAQLSREQYQLLNSKTRLDTSRVHEKLMRVCGRKASSLRMVRQWIGHFIDGKTARKMSLDLEGLAKQLRERTLKISQYV